MIASSCTSRRAGGMKVQCRDGARLGRTPSCRATRWQGCRRPPGQFSSWWCTSRRPCHHAERRAGKGTPTSGRHSPPKAGGEKDPQVRGGPFSAGTSAFSVIRTAAWYTPFAALRAAVPTGGRRSRADGTIPDRLGSAPPRPSGPLCRPEVGVPVRTAPSRTGWGLRRRGPPGRCADRRSAFPCGRHHLDRLGSAPPRPSGPLCRPEVGVPVRTAPSRTGWGLRRRGPPGRCADRRSAFPEPSPRFNADRRYAVRSSEIRGAQRCWCGFRAPARCRSETGAPCPRDSARGGVLTSAKTMAANFVRCQRDRGESVKGGLPPPFHESTMTNRNSPPRAEGAQGSFDCRREAPGGPGMGAYRSQSA